MNLILLLDDDFTAPDRARLTGRRLTHLTGVHRAKAGDVLTVGRLGGVVGRARVALVTPDAIELETTFDAIPPEPLPLTLILALPRPKVLNRVIAGVTSMGVKRLILINAWKVEKAYWQSPRLSDENLRLQRLLGLEQAGDTVLPSIELRRLFRPFVEEELPALSRGTLRLVAHPSAAAECPRGVTEPVTLAVGPEGGWIDSEIASLERAGFHPVGIGRRILRTETAVAALIGRLF